MFYLLYEYYNIDLSVPPLHRESIYRLPNNRYSCVEMMLPYVFTLFGIFTSALASIRRRIALRRLCLHHAIVVCITAVEPSCLKTTIIYRPYSECINNVSTCTCVYVALSYKQKNVTIAHAGRKHDNQLGYYVNYVAGSGAHCDYIAFCGG